MMIGVFHDLGKDNRDLPSDVDQRVEVGGDGWGRGGQNGQIEEEQEVGQGDGADNQGSRNTRGIFTRVFQRWVWLAFLRVLGNSKRPVRDL